MAGLEFLENLQTEDMVTGGKGEIQADISMVTTCKETVNTEEN